MKYLDENRTAELVGEIKTRLDTKEPKMFKGTTAEWNALSAEEQDGYSVKIITDDGDGTNEVYSTTETKTNKVWIDGKPVYRKVLVCTTATTLSTTSGWTNVPGWSVENTDIDKYINVSVCEMGYTKRIDYAILDNKMLQFGCLASTIIVYVNTPLAIEYTKTTD